MSLVFAVVVVAHQLTPYIVAGSAIALVALGLVRSYQIIPIIIGLAVGYLIPRYGVVDHYGLFQGFNFFSHAQTVASGADESAGRVFNHNITLVMVLVVWGLAVLAVGSAWRRPGPVALPGLLAFAPFGVLLVQSYGGEAIFRVYLFSAPWCAYLIASLVLRRRWLPHLAGVPTGASAVVLAVICTLQIGQGQAIANVFTTADVAAAEYVYSHAEPGARLVVPADNFPANLTANSDSVKYSALIDETKRLYPYELTDAGASALDARFDDSHVTYLVFSPSMVGYLRYYGYMSADTLTTLQAEISKSPRWQLVFNTGGAFVYRRAPGQTTTLPPGPGVPTQP
jgi:hypothetical protein